MAPLNKKQKHYEAGVDQDEPEIFSKDKPESTFKEINLIFGIGLAISFLAFLLHIIGVSTTRWSYRSSPDFEYGIFRYCVGSTCTYYSNKNSDKEASQAMAIIAAIFVTLATILATVHVILIVFRRFYEEIPIACLVCSIGGSLSVILCVIVWMTTSHDDLRTVSTDYNVGWSLAVDAVGGGLMAVSAALFYFGRD